MVQIVFPIELVVPCCACVPQYMLVAVAVVPAKLAIFVGFVAQIMAFWYYRGWGYFIPPVHAKKLTWRYMPLYSPPMIMYVCLALRSDVLHDCQPW